MPLATSGTISIGGSTANRSINLELGRSATATSSLGESALRDLAGVPSGAISMSNFYGKSAAWSATLTVGYWQEEFCIKSCTYYDVYGYGSYGTYTYGGTTYTRAIPAIGMTSTEGSLTDTTFDDISNATILGLYHDSFGANPSGGISGYLYFSIAGHHSNAGFTTLTIGTNSYSRTNASYIQDYQDYNAATQVLPYTYWTWIASANPFPTTEGSTVSISIS